MEHSDSQDTDENVAAARADDSENQAARLSAIERQIAAVTAADYGNDAPNRYILDYNSNRRKPRRFGLVIFLALLPFIAIVAVLMLTDLGRPVQNAVNTALQAAQQTAAASNFSSANNSPATIDSSRTTHSSQANNSSQDATNSSPASESQTVAPTQAADVATSNAISIPIADISLRSRPELLEQLVHVYRSRLTADAKDTEALAALTRLQERSLSELETIIAAGDDAMSVRSLEVVSRIFPELADTARYKYLVARTDYMQRDAKAESATKPEATATNKTTGTVSRVAVAQPATPQTTPSQAVIPAASNSQAIAPAVTAAAAAISPVKPIASPPPAATATGAKNSAENIASLKPEVRVVSITPGTMVEQRFVPGDEGKVFMVEINYRNFKNAEDQSEGALIARLGAPSDSMVLAEAPVEILGDRGTKSFLMEALVSGNTGETYKLNFILNGEFLASRAVRLSPPGQ